MNWGVSDLKAVRLLCVMFAGKTIFSQIVEAIHPQPIPPVRRTLRRDYKVRQFSVGISFCA